MNFKNEEIKTATVKVIDANGEFLGTFKTPTAIQMAKESNLDLVQLNDAQPPVCKLVNYGKFLYDEKKRVKENKTKVLELKDIQIRPNTGVHDLDIKAKQIRKFLDSSHKVRITLSMRGRERSNREFAASTFNKFLEMVAPYTVDKDVSETGNRFQIQIRKAA